MVGASDDSSSAISCLWSLNRNRGVGVESIGTINCVAFVDGGEVEGDWGLKKKKRRLHLYVRPGCRFLPPLLLGKKLWFVRWKSTAGQRDSFSFALPPLSFASKQKRNKMHKNVYFPVYKFYRNTYFSTH